MSMSKRIGLRGIHGKEKFAIVDDEDYDYLISFKWHYNHGYAATTKTNGQKIRMHKLVLKNKYSEGKSNLECDHVNRDRLDNRKLNLRLVSKSQNQINKGPQKNNSTGFKGVCMKGKRFIAQIRIYKKHIYLGIFGTKEEAAFAYDRKAKELFGDSAYLNFG